MEEGSYVESIADLGRVGKLSYAEEYNSCKSRKKVPLSGWAPCRLEKVNEESCSCTQAQQSLSDPALSADLQFMANTFQDEMNIAGQRLF